MWPLTKNSPYFVLVLIQILRDNQVTNSKTETNVSNDVCKLPCRNVNDAFPHQDTRTLGSNQVPTIGFHIGCSTAARTNTKTDNVLACHAGVLRAISIAGTRPGLKNKRTIEISRSSNKP